LTRIVDAGVHLAHDVDDHGDEQHRRQDEGADDLQHASAAVLSFRSSAGALTFPCCGSDQLGCR
jgi:hypothetical protein